MTWLIQALHGMAATAWVGGIFFAYMALRPAANLVLEPGHRLRLWQAAFSYFFPWVWLMIGILLITGYADMFSRFDGFKGENLYLNLMHAGGLLMVALFGYLYFRLYKQLSTAINNNDIPSAAMVMNYMRPVMVINLSLGMIIISVAIAGHAL